MPKVRETLAQDTARAGVSSRDRFADDDLGTRARRIFDSFLPPSHPVVDYLVFVEIFLGHIILRHFARSDTLRYIVSGFDAADYLSLERVAFLDQFADAFRIRTGRSGQSLQISG